MLRNLSILDNMDLFRNKNIGPMDTLHPTWNYCILGPTSTLANTQHHMLLVDTCFETCIKQVLLTKLGLPIKQSIPHLTSDDLNLKATTAMASRFLVLGLLAGVHSAPTTDDNLIPGTEMLTSLVSSCWLPNKISCISKSREQWIIV